MCKIYTKFLSRAHNLQTFQSGIQVQGHGLKQCDFVVFTNMGIFIANVDFDKDFWKDSIDTEGIIPAI